MDLGKEVVSSLKWVTIAKFAGQIFTWSITIIVIRILNPEDYGLLAIAFAVMSFITLVNEMGLGSVIVQKADLAKNVIEKILGLLITVNIFLYLLIYISAPYISAFFEEPALISILRVVGIELLLGTFIVVPDALLTRQMRFQYLAVIGFIKAVSASAMTLVLALMDYGVWSLVYGNLFGVVVEAIALMIVVKQWHKPNFVFMGIRKDIGFGGLVAVDRVLWFLYSEGDTFIIGKALGKELLGIYTVANQLAAMPSAKIAQLLCDIAFSAFSRVQEDLEKVGRYFLKSARVMGFVTAPIFVGLSSVAPEVVSIFLGEKWLMATLPLQLLSFVLLLRLLHSIVNAALMGVGRPDINVKNQIIACIMIPGGILVGVNWGIEGACYAWAIVFPIYFIYTLTRSLPLLGVNIFQYLSALRGAFVSSLIMYLMVYWMRIHLDSYSISALAELPILIVTGALSYTIVALIIQRNIITEIQQLVRPAVK